MDATGTLYLGKTAPLATTAADGTFALTLLAMDRIGVHKVEPYRITYTGPWAALFWQAHHADLMPGQPLAVKLQELRSFVNGHRGGAELHARAQHIELLPRAHPFNPLHQPHQEQHPCPQSSSH